MSTIRLHEPTGAIILGKECHPKAYRTRSHAFTSTHIVALISFSFSRLSTTAVASGAYGWWSRAVDEEAWGWWWPGARGRTGSEELSPASVRLDSTEQASETERKPKPNVFFIMIDDMGWNDIGYQSTDLHAVTPSLNKMATAGVRVSPRVCADYYMIVFFLRVLQGKG